MSPFALRRSRDVPTSAADARLSGMSIGECPASELPTSAGADWSIAFLPSRQISGQTKTR